MFLGATGMGYFGESRMFAYPRKTTLVYPLHYPKEGRETQQGRVENIDFIISPMRIQRDCTNIGYSFSIHVCAILSIECQFACKYLSELTNEILFITNV